MHTECIGLVEVEGEGVPLCVYVCVLGGGGGRGPDCLLKTVLKTVKNKASFNFPMVIFGAKFCRIMLATKCQTNYYGNYRYSDSILKPQE